MSSPPHCRLWCPHPHTAGCGVLTTTLQAVVSSPPHCRLWCPHPHTAGCGVLTPTPQAVVSSPPHRRLWCPHPHTAGCGVLTPTLLAVVFSPSLFYISSLKLLTGSHPISTEDPQDGRLPEESSWCSKLLCYPLASHWKTPHPTPSTCEALSPTETGTEHHHSVDIVQNGVTRSVITTLGGAIEHTPPPTLTDVPGVISESGEGESDGHSDGDDDVPTFEEFKHQKMIEQEAAKKTTPGPFVVYL